MQFFFVYVSEAHPTDEASAAPQTIEERVSSACDRIDEDGRLKQLSVPVLVDDMDDSTRLAYEGFPARTVLVGRDGRVAWASGHGPFGITAPLNGGEAEGALGSELAEKPPTKEELEAVAEEEAEQLRPFYGAEGEESVPVVRIDCGATEDYTDRIGRLWSRDRAFGDGQWGRVGGRAAARGPHWVVGTRDWPVFVSAAEGMDAYRIPVKNGRYTVRLHFAELHRTRGTRRGRGLVGRGDRVFTVTLEGEPALRDFDILEAAGERMYAAVVKAFAVEVADGEVTVEFSKGNSESGGRDLPAMINAIEVLMGE